MLAIEAIMDNDKHMNGQTDRHSDSHIALAGKMKFLSSSNTKCALNTR